MPMRPFEAEEYASRLVRLQAGLTTAGLDGVLLTETANFEYVTGHVERVMWTSMTRILAVWVPASGRPTLLVPTYVQDVAAEDTGWEVRNYDRIDQPPIDELVALIRGGGERRRIGLELAGESRLGMAATTLRALEHALPDTQLVDGAAVMWDVRIRKSAAEVERLRRACAANTAGFASIFAGSLEGRQEDDVARDLERAAHAAGQGWGGWTQPGWVAMTSGPGHYHRFMGHPRPRRIERGDMVWADLGVTVDGYWSDYCRAAVVGGPTQQQRDRQARILEATAAGIELARPGRRASDVAGAVGDALVRLGLPNFGFGRVGHGIGLTATEPPSVARHDDTVLEAGMVITVEPASVEDDGIYCAEQIVVVGDPPEILSTAPTALGSV
jgi:Xaa-Pro aminopeptidase